MSQAGANSSSGSVSTTITITGNDANPQTASAFTIVGVDNFLFDWSVVDSEFQISPPNSLIWGANSNSTTSGTLIAGNSNILLNPGDTTVALPSNVSTALGDVVEILSLGGQFTISQSASQQIYIGNSATTSGATGFVVGDAGLGNALSLRCITVTGTYIWIAICAPQGTYTTN